MNFSSYIVITIYGALLLLSFLLLTNPLGVNKKANFWFGISFLLWTTFWFEELLVLIEVEHTSRLVLGSIQFIQFLAPILFFFSVLFYTNPDHTFKKTDLKYSIAPLVFLSCIINQQSPSPFPWVFNLMVGLIILQAMFYILLSWVRIKQHKRKILQFSSNTLDIDLNWLVQIIYALLALIIFIGIYNVFFNTQNLNLFANAFVAIIIFYIAFHILKQKEIFILKANVRNEIIAISESTTKKKVVSDAKLIDIKNLLTKAMAVEKLYLDSDLSLKKLAFELNITPHQLSYVINTGFDQNFFVFINKYRVNHAKELLLENEENRLSFIGIAYEAGFNSKTSFNTTFKKITRQTPSEFKKLGSN